jgi:site-specific recombinase XerD
VSVVEDGAWRGSVAALLSGFERYLMVRRNVRSSTQACYLRHAGAFLAGLAGPDGSIALGGLGATDVRDHVSALMAPYAPQTRKLMATSFRGFLRFAWLEGVTACDLTGAVGPVAAARRAGHLPRSLPKKQVQLLLETHDPATLAGVRDHAVLVVLARLGLRASEVAALRLDDLDWESGAVSVRVKGGGVHRLPIPHDVGVAIVDYLHRRPDSRCREVFVQLPSPDAPMTGWAVSALVARAAAKAGVGAVRAHRLRHSAARAVLEAGGGIAEVGELLGHRSLEVTRMYASLDLHSLRALARPWPGSGGGQHE